MQLCARCLHSFEEHEAMHQCDEKDRQWPPNREFNQASGLKNAPSSKMRVSRRITPLRSLSLRRCDKIPLLRQPLIPSSLSAKASARD